MGIPSSRFDSACLMMYVASEEVALAVFSRGVTSWM